MEPASPLGTPELMLCEGPGLSARNAFTLIELLVVIAIVAILIAITLPALFHARKAGRLTQCQSNFRSFGTGIASYATDNADRLLSFTWQPDEGPYPTPYADLQASTRNPGTAISRQATHLIRATSGFENWPGNTNWFPAINYVNLVLEAYLGTRLDQSFVCPEHRLLLYGKHELRQSDHESRWENLPEGPMNIANWGMGSSYSPTVGMYTNDHALDRLVYGLSNDWYSNWIWGPRSASFKCIGRRRLHEVSFTSNKIAMWEHADRHVGKSGLFFLYETSRQPYLFFDGSVRMYTTRDINPGSDPRFPERGGLVQFVTAGPALNEDARFEANFLPGDMNVAFPSRGVTTRMGLKGIDVGGDEVFR